MAYDTYQVYQDALEEEIKKSIQADPDIWSAWDAVCTYKEKVSMIAELLSRPGANVNVQDQSGVTPLHYLTFSDSNILLFRKLLRHPEINVNIQTIYGATPLHFAVNEEQENLVQELLAHPDIDPNIQTVDESTPLHYAIISENDFITEQLLAHPKIDVNAREYCFDIPLLFCTILQDTNRAVQLLIQHPLLDVNAQSDGYTLLHLAIMRHHIPLLELLLAHPNIDVNVQNKHGETALTMLLGKKDNNYSQQELVTVKLFLEAGAYTLDELDLIKEKYPEVWKEHTQRFYQTQKALDEGPLARLPSVISSVIAEALYPGVLFWKAESEE